MNELSGLLLKLTTALATARSQRHRFRINEEQSAAGGVLAIFGAPSPKWKVHPLGIASPPRQIRRASDRYFCFEP